MQSGNASEGTKEDTVLESSLAILTIVLSIVSIIKSHQAIQDANAALSILHQSGRRNYE